MPGRDFSFLINQPSIAPPGPASMGDIFQQMGPMIGQIMRQLPPPPPPPSAYSDPASLINAQAVADLYRVLRDVWGGQVASKEAESLQNLIEKGQSIVDAYIKTNGTNDIFPLVYRLQAHFAPIQDVNQRAELIQNLLGYYNAMTDARQRRGAGSVVGKAVETVNELPDWAKAAGAIGALLYGPSAVKGVARGTRGAVGKVVGRLRRRKGGGPEGGGGGIGEVGGPGGVGGGGGHGSVQPPSPLEERIARSAKAREERAASREAWKARETMSRANLAQAAEGQASHSVATPQPEVTKAASRAATKKAASRAATKKAVQKAVAEKAATATAATAARRAAGAATKVAPVDAKSTLRSLGLEYASGGPTGTRIYPPSESEKVVQQLFKAGKIGARGVARTLGTRGVAGLLGNAAGRAALSLLGGPVGIGLTIGSIVLPELIAYLARKERRAPASNG